MSVRKMYRMMTKKMRMWVMKMMKIMRMAKMSMRIRMKRMTIKVSIGISV